MKRVFAGGVYPRAVVFHWTYKELKPVILLMVPDIFSSFIEPIRNWNYGNQPGCPFSSLPFIEPIRNWNDDARHEEFNNQNFHWTYKELKPLTPIIATPMPTAFIEPIRNWNRVCRVWWYRWYTCFHWTYKELKHNRDTKQRNDWGCFHWTYKELKRACLINYSLIIILSLNL